MKLVIKNFATSFELSLAQDSTFAYLIKHYMVASMYSYRLVSFGMVFPIISIPHIEKGHMAIQDVVKKVLHVVALHVFSYFAPSCKFKEIFICGYPIVSLTLDL